MTTLDPKARDAATLAIMPWLSWKPAAPETIASAAITAYLDALSSIPAQAVGVNRILRGWDAGREVGVNAMRSAVAKMIGEWQAEMSAKGLIGEHNQANVLLDRLSALAPSQPAAVGVTDEMVEAIVQAVRPYTHRTLFLDEHRDLVRAALRSTP